MILNRGQALEVIMCLRCLLVGCLWTQPTRVRLGSETLLCQRCSRCASKRYRPDDGQA
ncbi:PSPA7_2676 family Cys-rich small protein [Pseudomonas flexibilis]|uniref:PSPA7_2676 family Cys-rich small protein n=1 Tax=Pseudomonas flexibilis TaxID=706570 RepID=UPI000A635EB9